VGERLGRPAVISGLVRGSGLLQDGAAAAQGLDVAAGTVGVKGCSKLGGIPAEPAQGALVDGADAVLWDAVIGLQPRVIAQMIR